MPVGGSFAAARITCVVARKSHHEIFKVARRETFCLVSRRLVVNRRDKWPGGRFAGPSREPAIPACGGHVI